MENLAVHFALHGSIVLTVSLIAGLFLFSSMLHKTNQAAWHLVHDAVARGGAMLFVSHDNSFLEMRTGTEGRGIVY